MKHPRKKRNIALIVIWSVVVLLNLYVFFFKKQTITLKNSDIRSWTVLVHKDDTGRPQKVLWKIAIREDYDSLYYSDGYNGGKLIVELYTSKAGYIHKIAEKGEDNTFTIELDVAERDTIIKNTHFDSDISTDFRRELQESDDFLYSYEVVQGEKG